MGVERNSGSISRAAPRRTSGESAMDMRLQSPPANSTHYGHTSAGHLSARASSPRAGAADFSRPRQTSVSAHGFHGDYRPHGSEPAVQAAHYEYPSHHYPTSYQESPYAASHHATTMQQQQQPQQPQPQHQPHLQHQQYSSQYSQHSSSGYMRSSASEIDRPHPHGLPAQQHYLQGYPPQPPSPPQHSQALMPPHRGSIQDAHPGVPRVATSVQHPREHQAHHQHDRPLAENDEAIVMNFMSELQMQQQQQQQSHGHKQVRKPMPPPGAPQPQTAPLQHRLQQQHHLHHIQQKQQQQQQQQHQQHQQQQQDSPQQHHAHVDHIAHHPSEAQLRYGHGDHHGYQHNQETQSSVYRPQPPTASQPPIELDQPMTPPGQGQSNMHLTGKGTVSDTRQRPISNSTMTPVSPRSVPSPSYPTKSADAPKKLPSSSSQSSLPPSRSLSLINLLNAPETEANGDTTETDDEDNATIVVPVPQQPLQDRAYNEQNQLYNIPQESARLANVSVAYSESVRNVLYEEQPGVPGNPSMESQPTTEYMEQQEAGSPSLAKTTKDKAVRPVKDKVQKEKPVKVVKEKVVKEKAEKMDKTKKERVIKMPPKKKASVASAVLSSAESVESLAESIIEQHNKPVPPAALEPVVGSKHSIEDDDGHEQKTATKKIRVDSRPTADDKDGDQSLLETAVRSHQDEMSTASGSTPVSRPHGHDDSRALASGDVFLPELQATYMQEESSGQKSEATFDHGPTSSLEISDAPAEAKGSPMQVPKAASAATSARSRSSTPTSNSMAARYRSQPEDDPKGTTGRSKKSSNEDHYASSPPLSISREPFKGFKPSTGTLLPPTKEKKSSKKKVIADSPQIDDGTAPHKAGKHQGTPQRDTEDMDLDTVELKPSVKTGPSVKKQVSGMSSHTSLKKRFSRAAEDFSSLIENPKKDDVPNVAASETTEPGASHDRVLPTDSVREKSAKQKRMERGELSQQIGVKSEGGSKNQHLSSRLKESTTPPIDRLVREEQHSREIMEQTQEDAGDGLYCICRTSYDPSRFMIACDGCDGWFHGDCVGVAEKDSDMVDKYYCKRCEEKGRHGSNKKKCFREACQRPAARKSKYCSKECGLLVATQRIHESQARVFGSPMDTSDLSKDGHQPPEQAQQHIQRRRWLTLADLDDRQRLLGIREKMAYVRKVCSILEEREKQLAVCVDRQTRQELGKLVPPASALVAEKEEDKPTPAEEEEEEESAPRFSSGSKSKAKGKGQRGKDKDKNKDKESFCGFDYSLVWDDIQDMSRMERTALSSSLATTPAGSRASSVAPPSFGVVLVNSKRNSADESDDQHEARHSAAASADEHSIMPPTLSPQMEEVGLHVCMLRRQCDRHIGWQKLKKAELDLEKTLQNKLLKTLKVEAKLVKNRMKRRRNDLSAGILNGTIEH
ncbi:hypothetical protein BGZ54_000124 [Gamsiella multidivaricata]|nr:hypothetical protein BGZ54_000124 [Gamsiella multidivaricata]